MHTIRWLCEPNPTVRIHFVSIGWKFRPHLVHSAQDHGQCEQFKGNGFISEPVRSLGLQFAA